MFLLEPQTSIVPTTRLSIFQPRTCRRCTASKAAWRFSSAEAAEVWLESPPRRWPVEPVPQSWRRSNKWPKGRGLQMRCFHSSFWMTEIELEQTFLWRNSVFCLSFRLPTKKTPKVLTLQKSNGGASDRDLPSIDHRFRNRALTTAKHRDGQPDNNMQ